MKKLKKVLTILLVAVFVSTGLTFTNVKVKASSGQDVVSYAKRFFGVPYVWGGEDPSGFDCSGLVQYVYSHFGISLPRVADAQQRVGTAVSRNNLQPGDLVFFGNPAHHVGIYAGGGKFIEAPHTGANVRYGYLSNRSDFSGGRRISGITTYSKDFINSVQRDLARCSLYSGSVTGVIDGKTKEAIRRFRSVVGLTVNDTLDSSVVNALNQIVHKPMLGVNTKLSYATRFVQWWIGEQKDGLYDNGMKESVRQWQIKAGIWSASGADGVIREKDWNKILKQVDSSGYTKQFISSVQRDLTMCSFYSGSITGTIDGKTKEAIRRFRSTVGLTVNDTLDGSVVNALNQIVHKPMLGVNTKLSYATRFVQWWIGEQKDGLYDNEMKESVRQWQIKAGIWSASGADGVIREKDWNKILK